MLGTRNRNLIVIPRWQNEAGRFLRFLAVGLSGTLLDFAILSVLKTWFGWLTLPANLVSYSCGILNNYLLSRYWVYPEARKEGSLQQGVRFILISLVGLLLNNLLVFALEAPAGWLLANSHYGYIPAKIIATGVVLLWNFFANRYWTFSKVPNS
jgi:putative flippase GtrA